MGRIYHQRREFAKNKLEISDLNPNPFTQFSNWYSKAKDSGIEEYYAMTLATADASGRPSQRTVLLRGHSDEGFTFFTNYQSRKGEQIKENHFGSLLFYWPLLERQIRIEGKIVKTSPQVSDKYFYSRPEGSRIGAWASPQSKKLNSRKELDQLKEKYKEEFANRIVPRPEHWGGYSLIPDLMEFWQGRESRLHDRFEYTLQEEDRWNVCRLAP